MQLFVKDGQGKTTIVEVDQTDKVSEVRAKVAEKLGRSAAEVGLSHNGKLLKDDLTLRDYSIQNGNMLDMVLSVRGGK